MQTRAERDGDGFKLYGAKTWITNSPISDVCLVWAKLDGVVRGFLVPRGTDGLTTPEIHGKLSLRASITGEIVLDGARVGAEAVLGGEEAGVKGMKGAS